MEAVVSSPDLRVWQGRRVFLTGHTGFKGSWLALWLSCLGASVRGYALAPMTEPNLFTAARVAEHVEDLRGDVCDLDALSRGLCDFQPEIVFHLAAQPLVRASYGDPLGTYRTNVMGTANLLEAVRRTPSVRAVVVVTTDKVYENREWERAYVEDDPLGGYDPYASSKACAELVTAAYRQSFFSASGCRIATARAGNVIGGGDWATDRLLPDLLRGFSAGETVRIRRPNSVRPWQHVLEPLRGYLCLAEALYRDASGISIAYNFAPDPEDAWPVQRIVERVATLWGSDAKWVLDVDAGVHEAGLLRLDAGKARTELGWKPVLNLDTSLEWVVAWHRAFITGQDMQSATAEQIARYRNLLLP